MLLSQRKKNKKPFQLLLKAKFSSKPLGRPAVVVTVTSVKASTIGLGTGTGTAVQVP